MTAIKLTVDELAALLHAIEMTPLIERPRRRTINKIAAAYRRDGGDPWGEFPDLDPAATA